MFKFILGYISYFVIMAFMVFGCIIIEGPLAGKFLCLGLVSFGMGTPVAKHTRLGLVDKRYKETPIIWWQVLIGLILLAIGVFLVSRTA